MLVTNLIETVALDKSTLIDRESTGAAGRNQTGKGRLLGTPAVVFIARGG